MARRRSEIALDRWILDAAVDVRMIMQVHDELVFEVAEAELESAKATITRSMTSVASLRVPQVVDIGQSPNWDAAH